MPLQVTMSCDGSFRWPAPAARRMADSIHKEVREMVAHSRLRRNADGIALVQRSQLDVGTVLGKGAFSEVHEVRLVNDPEKRKYAMKHLKFKLMSQPENFRLAAAELAVEAHMLASFDHPNILKIRGWAANGVASFADGAHDSFFLVLDALDETLDQRICRWQAQEDLIKQQLQQEATVSSGGGFFDVWKRLSHPHENTPSLQNHPSYQPLYLEKLGVCAEIASALNYLHERGVIFRDLKPNNIGFLNGRVQLFDFGLSRELPGCDLNQPFEMSGKVGTLRYMAVEVACQQPYNVAADVFSWAMVSYEVLTLLKPFAGWTRDMHQNLVCCQGVRPEIATLPSNVRHMLDACWAQQPHIRPPMGSVVHQARMLEEQQLLVCVEQQAVQNVRVELPDDFMVPVRKTPARMHSETVATTASFLSAESLADYL
mmetsp:Transcript_8351/g.16148  ORF Transcript_8351/g.16148 Transcript_8351/m.16148 type:complete len:429 (+) Transcript_8351:109-1395(+)|eukprot:scaffold1170_cov174-Amphora_coffeaeformis.AAC.7